VCSILVLRPDFVLVSLPHLGTGRLPLNASSACIQPQAFPAAFLI
jgi:hypothetical protein